MSDIKRTLARFITGGLLEQKTTLLSRFFGTSVKQDITTKIEISSDLEELSAEQKQSVDIEKSIARITDEMYHLTEGFDWEREFQDDFMAEFILYAEERAKVECECKASADIDALSEMLLDLGGIETERETVKHETKSTKNFIEEYATSKIVSLKYLCEDTFLNIQDNSKYVVTDFEFSSKANKKKKNAAKSYAYWSVDDREWLTEPHNFIVLFDMTAFGSASDGITISENAVFWKSMTEDRAIFWMNDIKNISVRSDSKELVIDKKRFEYYHSEITPGLRQIVSCINKFKNQQALMLLQYVES